MHACSHGRRSRYELEAYEHTVARLVVRNYAKMFQIYVGRESGAMATLLPMTGF
jgi:hypothetical protein